MHDQAIYGRGSEPFAMQQPLLGRIAYWTSRSRQTKWTLSEGCFRGGFFAQIERDRDGRWFGSQTDGQRTEYPTRKAAILEISEAVAERFDLEIRTSSRVVVEREGGLGAHRLGQEPEAAPFSLSP